MLEEARNCFRRGWVVFPIKKNSKEPKVSIREFLRRKPTNEEYRSFKFENYGVVTGAVSGICVLDIDPGGLTTLFDKDIQVADSITPTAHTPRGGLHYYFKHDPRVRTGVDVIGKGIDIRSDGGYVVGVGSSVDGKEYRWEPDFSPEDVQLSEPPEWMFSVKRPGMVNAENTAFKLDKPIGNGARNSTMISIAGSLVKRDLPGAIVLDTIKYLNQNWCESPLGDNELERIALNAERYRD